MSTTSSPVRIVVLQRGWVVAGRAVTDSTEEHQILEQAVVIRRWGTTNGLGELAKSGPTSQTVLDPAGTVRFHLLTSVMMLDADSAVWEGHLS